MFLLLPVVRAVLLCLANSPCIQNPAATTELYIHMGIPREQYRSLQLGSPSLNIHPALAIQSFVLGTVQPVQSITFSTHARIPALLHKIPLGLLEGDSSGDPEKET